MNLECGRENAEGGINEFGMWKRECGRRKWEITRIHEYYMRVYD
jgi:hypothetical protein